MVLFGQFVVGPPGSGKTTYCHGMKQFLDELSRECNVVNLDFANDCVPYDVSVDVRELIDLESVMEELDLGPNGGLVYCMEYLLTNIDWLIEQIDQLEGHYVLFDCPGQIELYTHHKCVQNIIQNLQKSLDARLCSIHLVDSYYCSQPHVFISAALHCASTMLRLGLPHVNILSKVDLLAQYGDLPFNLDFFTEMNNLQPLLKFIHEGSIPTGFEDENFSVQDGIDDKKSEYDLLNNGEVPLVSKSPFAGSTMRAKYYDLTSGLCEILEDFGMISFIAMNIEDAKTVGRVLIQVDKANGYCFAASEIEEMLERKKKESGQSNDKVSDDRRINQLFRLASQDLEPSFHKTLEIQEKYSDISSPLVPIEGGIINNGKLKMQSKSKRLEEMEPNINK